MLGMVVAAPAAIVSITAPAPAPAPAPATDQAAIVAALTDSAAGWNAGSLDRFMAVYADDATFVTKTGVVLGRAAIAERYRATFAAGGNTRGRLSFETLAYRPLGRGFAVLTARWTLTPAAGAAETGMTSLVFARRADGWKIVADHSS